MGGVMLQYDPQEAYRFFLDNTNSTPTPPDESRAAPGRIPAVAGTWEANQDERTMAMTEKKQKGYDLVVTRHQGLVDFLIHEGIIPEGVRVVAHATAEDVQYKHVIGILPLRLAALAASVTEATLELPLELRGAELTEAQVRECYRGLATYTVAARGQ